MCERVIYIYMEYIYTVAVAGKTCRVTEISAANVTVVYPSRRKKLLLPLRESYITAEKVTSGPSSKGYR